MGVDENASSVTGSMAAGGAMAALGGVVGTVKEKWNTSGGNEVISNVSASLPQGTQDYINEAKSKLFNLAYLRSPKVYFGVGEERPFYLEKNPQLLMPRLKHNFSFFYLNYMLLTALLFVLTLLISPGAIIGIGLLGLAWMSVVKATQSGSMTVKGITISQKQASVGMAGVSVLVLFYLLSSIFWWTLASSGFCIGVHALLRDASMHKDEEDKVEMSGDLGTLDAEDASFLNSPVEGAEIAAQNVV